MEALCSGNWFHGCSTEHAGPCSFCRMFEVLTLLLGKKMIGVDGFSGPFSAKGLICGATQWL